MRKRRLISMIAATGAAVAGLAVAANSAQAQWPPACQYQAHACVAVNNTTGDNVHSVRVNGQCLWFNDQSGSTGPNHYFPNVAISYSGTPTTLTYSGYRCEGNTQNKEGVSWDQSTGSGNYLWVHIAYPYIPGDPIG